MGNFERQSKRWKAMLGALGMTQEEVARQMGYSNVGSLKSGISASKASGGSFPDHLVRMMNLLEGVIGTHPGYISEGDLLVEVKVRKRGKKGYMGYDLVIDESREAEFVGILGEFSKNV